MDSYEQYYQLGLILQKGGKAQHITLRSFFSGMALMMIGVFKDVQLVSVKEFVRKKFVSISDLCKI